MTHLHKETLQRIDQLKSITPSEESTQRAISRARSALLDQPEEDQAVQPNRNPRHSAWRFAIGACVAASIVVLACLVFLGQDSIAFADVQQEMQKVRTAVYHFVTGPADSRPTVRFTISGTRLRIDQPGMTVIRVPEQGALLQLDHKERTAVYHRNNSGDKPELTDLYGQIASIADSSVKEIGKRTVDGKQAIGFEVPEPGNESGPPLQVWVDPHTRLPVSVDASGNRVLQDFQFDIDVSEELFKLKVPEGYLLENRYTVPQKPVALTKDELQKYTSVVGDPNRSPQQTIEAYLKLASAGESSLVQKMQERPTPDDIRELDGFENLELKQTFVADRAALGITSEAITYKGGRAAMVVTLSRHKGTWYLDDIDLETTDGIQEEIKRFQKRHPTAKAAD